MRRQMSKARVGRCQRDRPLKTEYLWCVCECVCVCVCQGLCPWMNPKSKITCHINVPMWALHMQPYIQSTSIRSTQTQWNLCFPALQAKNSALPISENSAGIRCGRHPGEPRYSSFSFFLRVQKETEQSSTAASHAAPHMTFHCQ